MIDVPEEDVRMFREAVRDVRPLRSTRPGPERPRPKAVARFSRAAREALLDEHAVAPPDLPVVADGEDPRFHRADVGADVLKRLRRGRIPVEGSIDLHGLTRHAAHVALRDFIVDARMRGLRCVRVVHGKGLRSGPAGPVLKHVVGQWLRGYAAVRAYASARPGDGGSGALYVLLAPAHRSRVRR